MKTRQILNPSDSIDRIQRSDDGYFNATFFLNSYNQNNKQSKKMAEFNKLKATNDFVKYLEENEGIKKAIRVSTKGTWMHPKVFIDFAMWISLEFKSQAIQWILDGLIKERNDVGDSYNIMCSEICKRHVEYYNKKPPIHIYVNEAKTLKDMLSIIDRNTATEKQLSILNVLQKLNTKLIINKVGKESRLSQLKTLCEALQ